MKAKLTMWKDYIPDGWQGAAMMIAYGFLLGFITASICFCLHHQ